MVANVSTALENVLPSVVAVEDVHSTISSGAALDEILRSIPSGEQCKLHVALAYCLEALWFVYLRVKGQDPHSHQVIKDLERVKKYILKVKQHTRGDLSTPDERTSKINAPAASRFVRHALSSDLSTEQKAGLDKLSGRTIGIDDDTEMSDAPREHIEDTSEAREFLESIFSGEESTSQHQTHAHAVESSQVASSSSSHSSGPSTQAATSKSSPSASANRSERDAQLNDGVQPLTIESSKSPRQNRARSHDRRKRKSPSI